jgi:ABC-type sugar transport system substrate-binding protein
VKEDLMTRKGLVILAVLVLLGAIVGANAFAAPKPITVGLAWNVKDDSLIVAWEDYMVAYSKDYGKKIGREFKWIINVADRDPSRQNANIEDLIAQHVDVIITRAEDSAAIGAGIKAAKAANIPIITLDRESSTDKPNAHVGSDGLTISYNTAAAFAKILKKNGVKGLAIELEGDLLDMNAIAFHDGWAKAEKESGAWKTVAVIPTEWKPEKFESGLTNALLAHPEANAIFVASDFAFDAVRAALEKAGRYYPSGDPKHVWIATIVCSSAGYPALMDRHIDVTGVWDAWPVSIAAVEVAARLVKGEKMDNKYFRIAGRLATPDNINSLDHIYARDYADWHPSGN